MIATITQRKTMMIIGVEADNEIATMANIDYEIHVEVCVYHTEPRAARIHTYVVVWRGYLL